MKRNEINEYFIIQNAVLGSHCLYEGVKAYCKYQTDGMFLPICYLFLPILYNNGYSQMIKNKGFKLGSFYKTLIESNVYYNDVIENADILHSTSSKALQITIDGNLLKFNKESGRFIINSNTSVKFDKAGSGNTYNSLIASSKRLGSWFGQLKDEEILSIVK